MAEDKNEVSLVTPIKKVKNTQKKKRKKCNTLKI